MSKLEMHLSLVNDCLTKEKADFFDPIKKVNLDIVLKKTKKILKTVEEKSEPKRAVSAPCYIRRH